MSGDHRQLISYIAPGAPATRRPATGKEPFLRPEIGFTPKWYHEAIGVNFDEPWHTDPAYRKDALIAMRKELGRRFPETSIGGIDQPEEPLDLLTGAYGVCCVAGLYGVPIRYYRDRWPVCEHYVLSPDQIERLEPINLDTNPFFDDLLAQVAWIAKDQGRVEGYINWQGVLNNAFRLRGEGVFADMIDHPDRARRLFQCVSTTMIEAASRLYERQRVTGVRVDFFTVSNCLVNMVSPGLYRGLLLPFDLHIAERFGCIGIHNCAWSADPYMAHYASVPHLGYIDMGLESDLQRAKETFPQARRALMYTPTELVSKPMATIKEDLERIGREYAPCDVVLADVEAGTPDERILAFVEFCAVRRCSPP